MTTKTQLVMVALVAVTVMSFGLTPAFAASTPVTNSVTAQAYDAETHWKVSSACGSGSVETELKISESYPYPEDAVKVTWDATRCSGFDSVTIVIEKNNSWVAQYTSTNDDASATWSTISVADGDKFKATFTFDY